MGNEADGLTASQDEITVMGRRNNARGELDCSSTTPLSAGSFFIYQTPNGMDKVNIAQTLPYISFELFFGAIGC